MKRSIKFIFLVGSLAVLAACASSEYIISTTDGTMITTVGKPKLDEQTGMYTYKGADGKEVTIKKDDVKQILER